MKLEKGTKKKLLIGGGVALAAIAAFFAVANKKDTKWLMSKTITMDDGRVGTAARLGYNLELNGENISIVGRNDVAGKLVGKSIVWSNGTTWSIA